MTLRKAVIDGSTVENVIIAEDDFEIDGRVLVTVPDGLPVCAGWAYEGGAFVEPEAPEDDPADHPLLPWQFAAMVNYLGKDADIRTAIAGIPDPMVSAAALARYEKSVSYNYADPLVEQLRAAIQLPKDDLRGAWLQAKALRSSG